MPSISERLRRPMDESMLLRLVLVAGLMSGTDLAKFYAQGGGGLDGSRSLEDFLAEHGVDAEQLKVLRRAYVETRNFGSVLLEYLSIRHAPPDRLREVERAMTCCETEQLVQIRRGQTPLPIGEMLVERRIIARQDLMAIIEQQGMARKIERYTSEAHQRATLAGRMRLPEVQAWLARHPAAPTLLAAGVVLAVGLNLLVFGSFGGRGDPFRAARNPAEHAANLSREHARMLAEARRLQYANAEFHRRRLADYLRRLAEAKVVLEDAESQHVKDVLPTLDFQLAGRIPAQELLALTPAELEKRLARKP